MVTEGDGVDQDLIEGRDRLDAMFLVDCAAAVLVVDTANVYRCAISRRKGRDLIVLRVGDKREGSRRNLPGEQTNEAPIRCRVQ